MIYAWVISVTGMSIISYINTVRLQILNDAIKLKYNKKIIKEYKRSELGVHVKIISSYF